MTLPNSGEIGDPCGVPCSLAIQAPSAITPACRKHRISPSTRLSLIRRAGRAISASCWTRSKNASRSTSTTHAASSAMNWRARSTA